MEYEGAIYHPPSRKKGSVLEKKKATLNGNAWEADNVPTTPGGTAVFQARAIPNSNNGGNGTGGSGGGPVTYDNPGNPDPPQDVDAESQTDKPPRLYPANYHESVTSDVDDEKAELYDCDGNLSQATLANDDYQDSFSWFDQQGGQGGSSETANWICLGVIDDWSLGGTHIKYSCPGVGAGLWQKDVFYENMWQTNAETFTNGFLPSIPGEHCSIGAKLRASLYNGASGASECYGASLSNARENLTVARTADTVMKLDTGGKSGSQRQNLFCLSASAWAGGFSIYPMWYVGILNNFWYVTERVSPRKLTLRV